MMMMVRKLFIEPIVAPTLENTPGSDAEDVKTYENIGIAMMNSKAIAPAIADAATTLDNDSCNSTRG